jgi:hypothetical protein
MVEGLRNKNDFADEDLKQFTWQMSQIHVMTKKFGHASCGAQNQEWLLMQVGNKLPDQVNEVAVGSQEWPVVYWKLALTVSGWL